jgi:two-component system response regulator MtrA
VDARILLVEDDPSIREVTAIGLRNAGFDVDTAADGQAGLDRFRAERYDLILLDVMLPRLTASRSAAPSDASRPSPW